MTSSSSSICRFLFFFSFGPGPFKELLITYISVSVIVLAFGLAQLPVEYGQRGSELNRVKLASEQGNEHVRGGLDILFYGLPGFIVSYVILFVPVRFVGGNQQPTGSEPFLNGVKRNAGFAGNL